MKDLGKKDLEALISTNPKTEDVEVIRNTSELEILLSFLEERAGKLSSQKNSPQELREEVENWLLGDREEVLLFGFSLSENKQLVSIFLVKKFENGIHALRQSAGLIEIITPPADSS